MNRSEDISLKWKHNMEIVRLNSKLDECTKMQRTVRKRIGDSIIFPPERRGIPGPNREKICKDAYEADEEYQRLIVEENEIRGKIEAWNTILSVGISRLPSKFVLQINMDYSHHLTEKISDAISKICTYDSITEKFSFE